jgi:DNA-binding MarR family transcriptional regulator
MGRRRPVGRPSRPTQPRPPNFRNRSHVKIDLPTIAAGGASARSQSPPAGQPPAERLLRLVHWTGAASRQLRRRLAEVAQAFELSDVELLVVWLCHGAGRVQIELAGAIGISPAQMSGLVERLRARELVAMHRSVADRRRQVWRTSAAGAALLVQAAGKLAELAAAVENIVSQAEQAATEAICERLAAAATTGDRRATLSTPRASQRREHQASREAA